MKSSNNNLFASLSKATLQVLTAEVKETLATSRVEKNIFTATDLWKVQRQFKTTRLRRAF